MKKLLSILGAVGIVASSASTVTACGNKAKIDTEMYLVTDTGKVDDKSFNQSAYEAGNQVLQEVLGKTDYNIGFTQPDSVPNIPNYYQNLTKNSAKIGILPGFNHQNTIGQAAKAIGDGTIVMLDGDTSANANVIGLKYKADISGFYAGISSIIWFFQNNKDVKEYKVATYGGGENPIAVDSYMLGFKAAVNFFNTLVKNEATDETITAFVNKFFKDRTIDGLNVTDLSDSNSFTGNFDQGQGKTISEEFLNKGAQLIFPVAGPQTLDTLTAIKSLNKDALVDGVDTDQVAQYADFQNYFITSGLKNLKGSTVAAIAHTPDMIEKIKADASLEEKFKAALDADGIDENTISFVDGKNDSTISNDGMFNNDKDWSGDEVWFGGDFAAGGKNKLTEDAKSAVIEFFNQDGFDLVKASEGYFNTANKDGANAESTLSDSTINAWVNALGQLSSSEE